MADKPKEDTAGDQDGSGALDERVGKLEAGQETLSGKLDAILDRLGGGQDGKPAGPPAPEGGGGNVAAEIRQQLEERDRKARAEADSKSTADRLAAAETKLAELAEKPPQAMPRAVERIMGWTR